MTYHLIIHYTNVETKETKYLTQCINEKYEILSYKNNAINASFDRFDAESEITKKLFPEFYKDRKKADQRHPQIKFLEFTKIYELSNDKSEIYDVKSILPIDISDPYQWIESTKLENEIFNKYKRYMENIGTIAEPKDYKVVNFVNKLVDASRVNKLVLFIGAGFSKNYGYPLWAELINDIKSKYGISDTYDPLKFAQLFYNTVGHHEYYTHLKKVFTKLPTDPKHDLLKEVFKISPNSIITTNYDELLEKSIHNLDYQAISSNDDLAYSQSSRLILKMHGDFKKNNIVFKEDDYLSYSKTHQLIEYYIQSLISSKTLLILGFSYDDINLKYIVQRIKDIHQQDFNRISIFFTDVNVPEIEIKYFESKGLDVLTYVDDIIYYLKGQSKLNCKSHEDRLFSFLSLLNQSINNEIGIEFQNPVEQAYTLFEKYKHLPTISPNILTKIKPFNETGNIEDAKFVPELCLLKMKENKFWKRFNQINFNYENFELSKDIKLDNLTANELIWWKSIFKNNLFSFIGYYGLKNSDDINKKCYIDIQEKNQITDLIETGKIKEGLQLCNMLAISCIIDNISINHHNTALYYLVHLGKVSLAAIIGSKLLTYYIGTKDFYNALRIIKILSDFKQLLKSDFGSELTDQKRDELYQFIHGYDEYEKLHDFNLTRFERANYLDIFGEELPNRLYKSSYDAYLKLQKSYEGYKRGGYMSIEPNYKDKIYYSFGYLYNQYFHNYDPILFYSNRKDFIDIFIYSNLLSVNISSEYQGKNKDGLNNFFLLIYIQLMNLDRFKTFHNKYPEIKFVLNGESKELLKNYINNFISSLISRDFKSQIVLDEFMISEMEKSVFLKQDINYQISKILIILSYLSDKEFRNEIIISQIGNIEFLIKERIVNDDGPIKELAFVLIEIDIKTYESYLNTLNVNPRCKDLKYEIFFDYLHTLFEKYGPNILENNFSFIFDEFNDLNDEYQILLLRFLIYHNQTELVRNLVETIQFDEIKNELIKKYLLFKRNDKLESIVSLLLIDFDDHPIETFTNKSFYKIGDDGIESFLFIIIGDNVLKDRLKNENLGSYFRFALFPNEINYKEINPKWLLTGHSDYNIKNLTKETIIIWLQKLVNLKTAFPDILIDNMYKKLGEALGKLNN